MNRFFSAFFLVMMLLPSMAWADGALFGRVKVVEPNPSDTWWKQAQLKPSQPANATAGHTSLFLVPKGKAAQEAPETATVIVRDFQFNPRSVLIRPQGTIHFINRSPYALTVVIGSEELKLSAQGGKVDWKAGKEGSLSVQALEYAHMQAGILVKPSGLLIQADALGKLPLTDLAPGSYEVQLYHSVWVKAPVLSVREGGTLGLEYRIELGAGAPLATVEAPAMPIPPRPVKAIPSVAPVAPPNPILPPTPPAPPAPPAQAKPAAAAPADAAPKPAPKPEPTPEPEENDDFFQIQ